MHSSQGHFLCSSLPFPAQPQLVLGTGLWGVDSGREVGWSVCGGVGGRRVKIGISLWLIATTEARDLPWMSPNVE